MATSHRHDAGENAAVVELAVRPERRLLRPGGDCRYLLCQIRVAAGAPDRRERRPVSLALVLDRSGSMSGEKLQLAKQAALALADRLAERDQLALVVFDDKIDLLQPRAPVTAALRARLRSLLAELDARGTTALHQAWLTGCQAIAGDAPPRPGEALARCFLLTDGLANVGQTDPEQIATEAAGIWSHAGIGTSTFGIGEDYNEALLGPLAAGGGGQFHHLRTPDAIATTFVNELGELLAVVAGGVRLELETGAGVEVEVISAYHGRPEPAEPRRWVIGIGDLTSGEERPVVVRLGFPSQTGPAVQRIRARLVWYANGDERQSDWRTVDFTYAGPAACEAEAGDPAVLEWVGLHTSARAQLESVRLRRAGRAEEAAEALRAAAEQIAAVAPASPAIQETLAELTAAQYDQDLKERYYAAQTKARGQRDLRRPPTSA